MSSISIVSTVGVTMEVLKTCTNENPLLIVDHAPWYKSAFEWIRGIEYFQEMFGIRNYIERWYRTFKQRTKRFFHNFPVRNKEQGIERIGRFLHLFAYWYNHMRPHELFKGERAVLVILTVSGGRQERAYYEVSSP